MRAVGLGDSQCDRQRRSQRDFSFFISGLHIHRFWLYSEWVEQKSKTHLKKVMVDYLYSYPIGLRDNSYSFISKPFFYCLANIRFPIRNFTRKENHITICFPAFTLKISVNTVACASWFSRICESYLICFEDSTINKHLMQITI